MGYVNFDKFITLVLAAAVARTAVKAVPSGAGACVVREFGVV
jgi:hypothetical protein